MIEVADLDKRAAYRLMTSLIVPRPIAWVGTRSGAGVDNLAPFSFFNGVSTQPALVSVSIADWVEGYPSTTGTTFDVVEL